MRPFGLVLACVLVGGCSGAARSQQDRGTQAAAEGEWDEALAAFERAVEDEPGSLALRRERVRAAHSAGRLPELQRRLQSKVPRQSGDGPGLYELALAVARAGEPGSDSEALELFELAAAELEASSEVPYRMGLIRLEQEMFCEAVPPLTRAAELDEARAGFRVALAAAHRGCGDEARARATLGVLPELTPSRQELERARAILARMNNPATHLPEGVRPAYRDAAGALEEEGAPGEAIEIIEEALLAVPDCAPLITLLGFANLRLGLLARATVAFERAIELWPGDPIPRLELAAIAAEAGRQDDAEAHLRAALEANPLSTEAWAELGRLQYRQRSYLPSAEAFERLSSIDGGSLLSRLWLGRALRRAGNDERAERVYLELLEARPRTFEASLQLGHIYRRRRVEETSTARAADLADRARRYYRSALEVRPQNPMVQRMLESLEEGD